MSPTRLPLIAGNWKMNTTIGEAVDLAAALAASLDHTPGVDVVLCPPFISLPTIARELRDTTLAVGAQNMHHEDSGAYTGEISPAMLTPFAEYVIIGHSERRTLFGEDDSFVNRKVHAALSHGLTPILCAGETLEQRESAATEEILTRQTTLGLDGLSPDANFVVAYEPIWAIGTGKAASASDAEQAIALIRRTISKKLSPDSAERTRILYGGSVKPSNITDFISSPEIDGALVGGASLNAQDFISIVSNTLTTLLSQSWSDC